MTLRWHLNLSLLLALLVLMPPLARAQAGKAELFGLVVDTSGLPAPQATVELEEQATQVKQSSTTTEAGEYHFFGLAPGRYKISATKQGFRTYQQEGLQLRVADRISLDIRLELGDVVQTVDVTACCPAASNNDRHSQPSCRTEKSRHSAPGRAELYPASGSFARCRSATGLVLPEGQRQPSAYERVHLRRYRSVAT